MNPKIYYEFDFSKPNRMAWNWRGHEKEITVPEEPVNYQLNDDSLAKGLLTAVSPVLADLLNVAVAVHMADRIALKQRYQNGSRTCHRLLHIKIAVDHCEVWRSPAVVCRLRALLGFLSQDSWSFDFVKRRERRPSESQQVLFRGSNLADAHIALFSGGLDSLAGMANHVASNSSRPFVAVSASPTNIHLGRQRKQFQAIINAFSATGTHICFRYSMRGGPKTLQEPSRRTRGFAFLVLGAMTALSAGADTLYVHENGFGALNLPYDGSQLGVDLTRAMHPTNLRNFADFISCLVGRTFHVKNDCVFLTKAEMCSTPAIRSLHSAIQETFSCDGLTRSGHHCGFCTSCLLRLLALESAGLSQFDHGRYLVKLSNLSTPLKSRHSRGILAMSWQVARLRICLHDDNPWRAVMTEFPEIQLAVADLASESVDLPEKLCRLYKKHVSEWLSFSAVRRLATQIAA